MKRWFSARIVSCGNLPLGGNQSWARNVGLHTVSLPGQGMSWRRAKVRGAGEGDEQKTTKTSFCFCWKEAAGSQPLVQTRLGYRTSSYLIFSLSLTKYKMQEPNIEVPLLPLVAVAETASQGWRWQERGCGIVGALLSLEHLQWCLASIASLLNYDKFFWWYRIYIIIQVSLIVCAL